MTSIRKETRERNQTARAELYQEQTEAIKLLRLALHRVLEDGAATSKEILRAAELLAQLTCPRNY